MNSLPQNHALDLWDVLLDIYRGGTDVEAIKAKIALNSILNRFLPETSRRT